jgi:hypothetical protein
VPTLKRPQINDAQCPRIPGRILKDASNEEVVDDVVAKVAMSGSVDDKASGIMLV